ncbi:hypothetical protein BO99DRAFT_209139 [Aspergillus violaceofuscus CBS 115571]|uniref:Uncharacterized protein n=1 Tax=Aspergillus violaceofuscus (strain CBS 115571) TaxID=1450538 RepID=A0A2V5HYU5_ASPV1|nr:hypothetical protein BO99DRAFT_209139 [Aspergillus violaceofuscus CBS 115571]
MEESCSATSIPPWLELFFLHPGAPGAPGAACSVLGVWLIGLQAGNVNAFTYSRYAARKHGLEFRSPCPNLLFPPIINQLVPRVIVSSTIQESPPLSLRNPYPLVSSAYCLRSKAAGIWIVTIASPARILPAIVSMDVLLYAGICCTIRFCPQLRQIRHLVTNNRRGRYFARENPAC